MPFLISIKAARVNAGKLQREAAAHIGVDTATIINWESGKTAPRVDQLNALCEYYKVPMDNLFLPTRLS